MSIQVPAGSDLAAAIGRQIQRKLEALEWTAAGDDSSPLSEYITLLLVNGKTQDEIASEISGENLEIAGKEAAEQFSRWLFETLQRLANGEDVDAVQPQGQGGIEQQGQHNDVADEDMGDAGAQYDGQEQQEQGGQANIPTGPKSMRAPNGNRLFSQINKHLQNSQGDTLRRRPQGDRIQKQPPTGPRGGGPGGHARGGMAGNRGRGNTNTLSRLPPHQQMNAFQQQQLAQAMGMPPGMPMPAFGPGGQPFIPPQAMPNMFGPNGMPFPPAMPGPNGMPFQPPGPNPRNNRFNNQNGGFRDNNGFQNNRGRGGFHHNNNNRQNFHNQQQQHNQQTDAVEVPTVPGADAEMHEGDGHEKQQKDLADVPCFFGLKCLKADCGYGHPSPSAPPGRDVAIDPGSKCAYGVKCKNPKCTSSHPSPASAPVPKVDYSEIECRFFPNCKNPTCPFKHPPMPLCRNGPNCARPDCHFTHDPNAAPSAAAPAQLEIPCRYNPCLNPSCKFKHEPGQQGAFENKVWKSGHVSERKFVENEGEEELIIPGQGAAAAAKPEADETMAE